MATTEEGLRARKKARTREAIVDAALRLFEERGYEGVTIAQIAEAADIAPRTFFGYFPSKEDVLFWDFEETIAGLRARLTERRPGESAVDAMRAWIVGLLEETDFSDDRERCRKRLIHDNETLAGRDRQLFGRFEEALAEAVAVDLGEEPGGLRARMVAGAAMTALGVLRDYFEDEDEDDGDGDGAPFGGDPIAMVDEALTFVRGGIAALKG